MMPEEQFAGNEGEGEFEDEVSCPAGFPDVVYLALAVMVGAAVGLVVWVLSTHPAP